MSDKFQKIYETIVEGAEDGLAGDALFKYITEECPKATSKRIVKASLLALSDPDMKDERLLRVIYDLAIKHRLDPVSGDDVDQDGSSEAPKLKADRKSKKSRKADTPQETPAR